MDDEQFERHKEFMLQQQAQFAEQQAQSAARIAQIEDLLVRFAQATRERFEATDRRAQELDEKMAALIDAQIQTEETVRKLGEDLRHLAATVDRHIVEGHNGRARPES